MNLLLTQFHDSPILNAVQNAFLEQIAELESVFEQLRNLIDHAEGAQLDMLGRIVGQKRFAMSDADYKLWIDALIYEAKPLGVELHLQVALKDPVFRFDMHQMAPSYFSEFIA